MLLTLITGKFHIMLIQILKLLIYFKNKLTNFNKDVKENIIINYN
jgi:hypothetical protein